MSETAPEPAESGPVPSDQPVPAEQSHAEQSHAEPVETVVAHETLRVRRAPRITHFLVIGAVVGVLVALILTFAFPENADYDRGQVFGFLLLFCGVIGLGLGALIALILDRRAARRSVTVVADRIDAHSGDNSQ